MKKFYTFIVGHTKSILTFFIVTAVICIFLKNLVAVDYDIKDYLPEGTPSTVSMEIMQDEFSGGIPNARVMIKNITIPEAIEYKEKLSNIDGVTDVTWLDDAADIKVPINTLDQKTLDTYYKNNTALFSVTIEEEKQIETVSSIRELIGDENAMSGDAVSTAVATTSTVNEIALIAAVAVAFVFFVLLLTTTSWLEPIIILAGLGIAIIINAGTNLIFGEISFVTNAAGNILQLAVSLDYSVFLLHRFVECKKENPNPKEAMITALCKSTRSILSSGITTVIGFFALIFMRFEIGPDLGLALAKGVAISLISVFIFMPGLILATYKLIEKTQHRPFMPSFKGFGKVIYKLMLPLACVFAVILVPSYLASNSNSFFYGAGHIFGENTQLGADTAEIESVYGKSDTYVLLVPKGDFSTERQLSDELHKLPQTKSIISYVDMVGAEIPTEYLDSATFSKLISENYSRMVISVDADVEGKETFELVNNIRGIADKYYPGSTYLAGQSISTYDLMDTITADMIKVNLIAIGAVLLVLILTMKSIFLPVILVLSIETAIWINMAIPYFAGSTVFYISYLIISSIQLGATVDYAILFTDRYREFRQTLDKKTAIIQTVSAVSVSILTSASVMTVVGFLLGLISTHGILMQLGLFLGKGTLLSLTIVLFVLPGLLYIFDALTQRSPGKIRNKKKKLSEVYEK